MARDHRGGTDEMAQPRITIRLMHPNESPLIHDLYLRSGGLDVGCADWTDVYPYWLIGDVDGVPSGIILVSPGKPFGRTDFLYALPELSRRTRSILLRNLAFAGVEWCKKFGSSGVLSTIHDADKGWLHAATRRGWLPICHGKFLLKSA